MQSDTLHLKQTKLPNGLELEEGWYSVRGLCDIEAIYEIEDGKIKAIDHGVHGKDDNKTIMNEAPDHYLVMCGEFNGTVRLDEHPEYAFVFKNNELIEVK